MSKEQLKKPARTKSTLTFILIALLLAVTARDTGFEFGRLINGIPEMGKLLTKMWPPDWAYFSYITEPILDTIRMAILGATFGALLAIPFSLMCASNVTKNKWILLPSRFLMNLNRAFPDLLMAAIFVAIVGLGPLAGIIALTLFSLGIVSKLMYESIEAIDPGPLEAMTAVGANKLQWIFFGVVPQVLPQYAAYSIYVFEINVRFAAILGVVGAGGIGMFYERTLSFFQYDRVSSIIIYTLIVVLIIDYVSTKVREKLI
jgi:phosphonate transport system permease protein